MKMLPQEVLCWVGLLCVPFAWLVWYFGPQLEVLRPVLAGINDPALRAALQEAHAERLGIWVGVWPGSLLVLSQILEKNAGIKTQLAQPTPPAYFGLCSAIISARLRNRRRGAQASDHIFYEASLATLPVASPSSFA
jgi:hypothetical protein